MTLYEKVQQYLISEGWKPYPQIRKDGDDMKRAPLVMGKLDAEHLDGMVVVITKNNRIRPEWGRVTDVGIKDKKFESMHIREFLEKGVDEVFKVRQTKRIK